MGCTGEVLSNGARVASGFVDFAVELEDEVLASGTVQDFFLFAGGTGNVKDFANNALQ